MGAAVPDAVKPVPDGPDAGGLVVVQGGWPVGVIAILNSGMETTDCTDYTEVE
jgi:hypothetical protein